MNDFLTKTKSICILLIFSFLFQTTIFPIKDAFAGHIQGEKGGEGNTGNPPPTQGEGDPHPTNEETMGDPAVVHNGEYLYTHQDLFIPSRGLPLEVTRTYRSRTAYNGRFGYGWHFNFDIKLKQFADNSIIIFNMDGKGSKHEYTYDAGDYTAQWGVYHALVQNPDGSFTLTTKHGQNYEFDEEGRLTSIQDRNGNSLTFYYDPVGLQPIVGQSEYFVNQTEGVIAYDYMLKSIKNATGDSLTFDYNTNGRLTSITDFTGRVYSYEYDSTATGDLISFTTPSTSEYPTGLTTQYFYTDHNIDSIMDAKDQVYVRNIYTDDRVTQQDYGPGTYYFTYETDSMLTTQTDPDSFKTEWTYDENGTVTSKKVYTAGLRSGEPTYYETTYEYNQNFERSRIVYPRGNSVEYTYDATDSLIGKGNLLEIRRVTTPGDTLPDIVTTFTYEPNFNFIKTVTDPDSNITTYTYDYELLVGDPDYGENGNLVRITYPQVGVDTPETRFSYDAYGQVESVTDPNLNVTQYAYYGSTGYLWKIVQDPDGFNYVTEFVYDAVGNPISIINAKGDTTTFNYNELNQLANQVSPSPFDYKPRYAYDEIGNLVKIKRQTDDSENPWQTTEYTYTILDQFESIIQYPSASDTIATVFSYDVNGNRSTFVTANGDTTYYEYDERNLIWKTTDALGSITEYAYDENGNLKEIKDANTNETWYAYDGFDRLQITTYADSSVAAYTYDINSNLIQLQQPDSSLTTYTYDALNRLDLKTYPDMSEVDYVYDVGSRLNSVIYGLTTVDYGYDAVNRVTSAINTLNTYSYTVSYEYDDVGNRTNLTYPSGLEMSYTYDELNRLTTINNVPTSKTVASYSYDALSRRTKLSLSNHTFTEYTYDDINRLTNLTNKALRIKDIGTISLGIEVGEGEGTKGLTPVIEPPIEYPMARIISNYTYTYDDVGNRLSKQMQDGQEDYGYDEIYQLTSVSGDQVHDYQFDPVGNRLMADSISYTPNELNQYTDVGGTAFQYETNGNLTDDGINTYVYDYDNRLVSSTDLSLETVSFEYDGFGRRVKKEVGGVATYFVYDGDQVIEERDMFGGLVASYVFGTGIDEMLIMFRDDQFYYYHYDGLGSVSDITDADGTTVESFNYDVYGQPSQVSSIGNHYYFTGRRYDDETGLYYYRARYYSPSIGRFLQRDPITWGPDDRRIILEPTGLTLVKVIKFLQDLNVHQRFLNYEELLLDILGERQNRNINTESNLVKKVIIFGGAQIPQLQHKYLYCFNNPLIYLDPTGELVDPVTAGIVLLGFTIVIIGTQTFLLWQQGDITVRDKEGNILGEMEVPGPK
jgi:RHS repeat-associated protein